MKFRIKYADKVVGFFIVVAALALATGIILLGANQRWFSKNYRFTTRFISAAGAAPGTAIMMKGFQVGKIDKVKLNEKNEVDAEFVIFDSYYPKVMEYSILEVSTSPIGLGTQLFFHPGRGVVVMTEGSFIPIADSEEGKAIIEQELVDIPPKDDTITRLLANVNPLIENVNKTVVTVNRTLTEINRAISGQTSGPLGDIVASTAAVVHRVDGVVANLNGAVKGVVGNVDEVVGNVNGLLADVDGLVANLDGLLAEIRGQANDLMTQTNAIVTDVKGQANELMTKTNEIVADVKGQADVLVGRVDLIMSDVKGQADGIVTDVRGQTDSIMTKISTLLTSINKVVENLEVTTAALRDPTGLVPRLLDPQGSLKTVLDDKNELYDKLMVSINEIQKTIKNVQEITASLSTQMPTIAVTVEEGKDAIKKAQDVLEGLKNNPLLKGGVPERKDQQSMYQGLREGSF